MDGAWAPLLAAVLFLGSGLGGCAHNGASGTNGRWRSATPEELQEEWRQRSDARFVFARGDFDGDGRPDEARLMLSQDGERLAIVVRLSGSDERIIYQDAKAKEHGLAGMGIQVLPPGRYVTVCGKGYFDCPPSEPNEVVTQWDGINFFHEEGADGVYYMREPGGEFRFIGLSD
jgi:hypothetical protein